METVNNYIIKTINNNVKLKYTGELERIKFSYYSITWYLKKIKDKLLRKGRL